MVLPGHTTAGVQAELSSHMGKSVSAIRLTLHDSLFV